MEYKNILKKRSAKAFKMISMVLIACLVLHLILLQFSWYSALPNVSWRSKTGIHYSIHYGLIGISLCAIILSVLAETIATKVRLSVCAKCGVSRAISKTTILLTDEQKKDMHKKSPELFTAIGLNLDSALNARVTANYVRCKNCNYQHDSVLKTDAYVPDNYASSSHW